MRFCSRCGFPMEGTMHLLASGGNLNLYQSAPGEKTISPRRKGVKQGAFFMLIGAILVPIFGVMAGFAPSNTLENVFGFFAALTAIICFLGGPLRMLFAAIFEEGAPAPQFAPPYPRQVMAPRPVSALPPPAVTATASWKRPQTAEIMQPPSVTDHTTRLLEKTEPEAE